MIKDYLEIKKEYERHKYNDPKFRKNSAIFHNIEEFIDLNEINIFYPKNMFVEDKDLEIYIFLESKILRSRLIDNDIIEIKILYLKDIKDFICECMCDGEYYHKLILKFPNDEIIVFDGTVDANIGWRNKFNKTIKKIIRIIINESEL